MRHSLKVVLLLAAMLVPSLGTAAPLQIWVYGHGNASDEVECDETSYSKPLKTLHKAIGCTFDPALLDSEIEIVLRCAPGTTCTYEYAKEGHGNTVLEIPERPSGTAGRTLRSHEPRSAEIQVLHMWIRDSNWVIDGIGLNGISESAGQALSLLRLTGNDLTVRNSVIGNAGGTCIYVGEDAPGCNGEEGPPCEDFDGDLNPLCDPDSVPHRVTIENNAIDGCYDRAAVDSQDSHCVLTWNATDLRVLRNTMQNCSGDGVHVGMVREWEASGEERQQAIPHCTSAVAYGLEISGNRMLALPRTVAVRTSGDVDHQVLRTIGEDGIDIKRVGSGLLIQENMIWGYRWKDKEPTEEVHDASKLTAYAGTGESGGGGGIGLQGEILSPAGGECAERPCALIEGNFVGNSQTGIAVAYNPDIGSANGVVVRGNYLHGMRGIHYPADPANAGQRWAEGLPLKLPSFANTDPLSSTRNLVHRNTIVDASGISIQVLSATDDGNYTIPHLDPVQLNLVSSAAPQCGHPLYEGFVDANGIARGEPGRAYVNLNAWTDGSPWAEPYPVSRSIADEDPSPTFFDSFGAAPTCGGPSNQCEYYGFPTRFRAQTLLPADLRLRPGATYENAMDAAHAQVEDASYARTHADVDSPCGATDYGASESCTETERKKLFLLDGPGDPGDEQCGSGSWLPLAVSGCFESPDIGFFTGSSATTQRIESAPSEANLPQARSTFLADAGSILVRVRSNGGMAPGDVFRLRVFGQARSDDRRFPASNELVADVMIEWIGAEPCNGRCTGTIENGSSSQLGWERIAGDGIAQIYRIPWPVAPRGGLVLRAEVSADGDARPQFFTAVQRSNNLAQTTIATQHFNFDIEVPVLVPIPWPRMPDEWQPELHIWVDVADLRPVYLFFPNHGEWRDDGTLLDLPSPEDGELHLLKQGANVIKMAKSYPGGVRFLVDSRLVQPMPREFIRSEIVIPGVLSCGEETAAASEVLPGSRMEWRLAAEGWRESFEWETDWDLGSSWGVRDITDGDACSLSSSGRHALGFGSPFDACPIEGVGNATSTPIDVPAGGPRYLEFRESVRAGMSSVRRVAISTDGAQFQPLAEWTGSEAACPGTWCTRTFDVSAFAGQAVWLRFEVDSPLDPMSWHVDDLEVL